MEARGPNLNRAPPMKLYIADVSLAQVLHDRLARAALLFYKYARNPEYFILHPIQSTTSLFTEGRTLASWCCPPVPHRGEVGGYLWDHHRGSATASPRGPTNPYIPFNKFYTLSFEHSEEVESNNIPGVLSLGRRRWECPTSTGYKL